MEREEQPRPTTALALLFNKYSLLFNKYIVGKVKKRKAEHRCPLFLKTGTQAASMATQGNTSLYSPLVLLLSSSSPRKLAPEALAEADAGMGDARSQGAFPPSRLRGWGARRDGTSPASIVLFDENGSMHNLSSGLFTLSNHLCSG